MTAAAQLVQARHWLQVGKPERCLEILATTDGGADDAELFRLRANALTQLARWEEAVDNARRGLTIDPTDLILIFLLATSAERTGPDGFLESERVYLHGLSVDPRSVILLTGYANLLTRFYEVDKAGQVLDRAAAVDPQSILIDLARMRCAFVRGKRREANAWVNRALAKDSGNTQALAFGGMLDRMNGRAGLGARRLRMAATQRLGDRALASQARHATVAAHPLMWPVRLLTRLPQQVRTLTGLIVLVIWAGLSALGASRAGWAVLIAWLALVTYAVVATVAAQLIVRRRR